VNQYLKSKIVIDGLGLRPSPHARGVPRPRAVFHLSQLGIRQQTATTVVRIWSKTPVRFRDSLANDSMRVED
jgi:hypothetical protein